MPARALQQLLDRFGDEHIVLTAERLFISSTLREEAWLLLGRDASGLMRDLVAAAAELGIAGADADRQLSTYSGGEQVMLALLLTLGVIREDNRSDVHLLLHNLLGSLSARNRLRMTEMLREAGAEPLRLSAYAMDGEAEGELATA